ncbi:MAG: OmpA family protein [Bacteroidales bacterium]|nr:OmpA family protein [Bacteroidales bacterium]
MKKKIILTLLILFPLLVVAQTKKPLSVNNRRAIENYNKALKHYDRYDYIEALRLLRESIRIEPKFIEAYLVTSQTYYMMNNIPGAIESIEKAIAIDPQFYPRAYYTLGRFLLQIGEYQQAKAKLEHYLTLKDKSKNLEKSAHESIERCVYAINAMANPVPYNPINLGSNLNTDLNEYWPSLSVDEKTLVYTVRLPKSANTGIKDTKWQEDFYISTQTSSNQWSQGIPLGAPLNTPINEGAQALSADGRTMYYTICSGVCNLYTSVMQSNGTWAAPVKLPPQINNPRTSEKQPSISPDGKTLYFVSNRPGGLGGFDIWKSDKNPDGTWDNAVNMGEPVNSPGDEQSPFIHFDNQTLYFASNGHMGMGSMDIFISRLDSSGKWGTPQNFGYPINTHKSEEGLIVNAKGTIAYYSTDIIPERGRDIFTFTLYPEIQPIPTSYVTGIVKDSKTLRPLTAQVSLVDLSTQKELMHTTTPTDGKFLVCLPTNKSYGLFASAPNYLFHSEHFDLKGVFTFDKPYHLEILLNPIDKDEVLVLRNIFFALDSYELQPESTVELDKLVTLLLQNPNIKIEIGGHTDNLGSDEYNQQLSENRAKSVAEYLISKQVESSRVKWVGYGETRPLTNNSTPEGRAQNRRTEVKIL